MGLGDLATSNPIECECGERFLGNQRSAMGSAVDHLIEEHGLLDAVEPPVQPKRARKNVLISEENVRIQKYHPDERNIQGEYELVSGNFLNTNYNREAKERYLSSLAEGCGVGFDFNW